MPPFVGLPSRPPSMTSSLGGGRAREKLRGLQLTSTAQNLISLASILNVAHRWMRVWWRSDATSSSGTKNICGTNNFNSTGVGVIAEATSGANRAKHIGFAFNAYTSINARDYHVPSDADVGLLNCDDIYNDGTRIWHVRFGRAISIGTVNAGTSFATTAPLGVNRRAATGAAALGYGAMTIVGIQFSTAVPTIDELNGSFHASPNTPIREAIAHWAPADLGPVGGTPATWTDKIGARVLTTVGTPSVVEVKPVATRWMSVVGAHAMASSTQDFASRCTAVGGQCLGPNNGTTPRLDTFSADLDAENAVGNGAILAYGVNDLSWRVLTLGQTAQQACDALLADVETAIGLFHAKRPNAPLFVEDVIRLAVGANGESATVRAAIDLYNAALPAFLAAQLVVHSYLYLNAVCVVVTSSQAVANDTGTLYDGVHETPAAYAIHAGVTVATVKASGWTHLVLDIFGDSRALGRISGGSAAGGWRRAVVNGLCEAAV